jgi:hypothetical protein
MQMVPDLVATKLLPFTINSTRLCVTHCVWSHHANILKSVIKLVVETKMLMYGDNEKMKKFKDFPASTSIPFPFHNIEFILKSKEIPLFLFKANYHFLNYPTLSKCFQRNSIEPFECLHTYKMRIWIRPIYENFHFQVLWSLVWVNCKRVFDIMYSHFLLNCDSVKVDIPIHKHRIFAPPLTFYMTLTVHGLVCWS